MSFNRTENIISRVKRELEKLSKPENDDVILEEMNNIQNDLCYNFYAMESKVDLTLLEGETTYDLNGKFHKIANFIKPASWNENIPDTNFFTSLSDWKDFVENYTGTSQPMGLFIWNNYLNFHPAPNTSGEKIQAFLYGLPSKEITIETNPELLAEWDDVLFYGILANIIGGDYMVAYAGKANNVMTSKMKKTTNGLHKRKSFIDGIGF